MLFHGTNLEKIKYFLKSLNLTLNLLSAYLVNIPYQLFEFFDKTK